MDIQDSAIESTSSFLKMSVDDDHQVWIWTMKKFIPNFPWRRKQKTIKNNKNAFRFDLSI
jgi:hypothetical protein